jgi:hypothetical protein
MLNFVSIEGLIVLRYQSQPLTLSSKYAARLEKSIIKSAPFVASFLEIILNFQKSQNTPFGASFLS